MCTFHRVVVVGCVQELLLGPRGTPPPPPTFRHLPMSVKKRISFCAVPSSPAVLQSWSPAVLQSCSPAVLQSCRPAVLQSCRPAVLQSLATFHREGPKVWTTKRGGKILHDFRGDDFWRAIFCPYGHLCTYDFRT